MCVLEILLIYLKNLVLFWKLFHMCILENMSVEQIFRKYKSLQERKSL